MFIPTVLPFWIFQMLQVLSLTIFFPLLNWDHMGSYEECRENS